MQKEFTVALAGNPNSGKTTIFNRLTGNRQHVGNYPGVTVERKEGLYRHKGATFRVVDLPGTYSLTANSVEERIARDVLLDDKPAAVVCVIDSSNLERNLYLAVQIIELGIPMVLAFNMSDLATSQGLDFDLQRLARLLGTPIVPTTGHKGRGMLELRASIHAVTHGKTPLTQARLHYGQEIEEEIGLLQGHLEDQDLIGGRPSARWLALKLLESDPRAEQTVAPATAALAAERIAHLEGIFGEHAEILAAEQRYGFISGICRGTVRSTAEARHTFSDRIDRIVLNRLLGIPIFMGLMYLVFQLTFTLGTPPMDWIETFFGWASSTVSGMWPQGTMSLLHSLLVDGIIGGVGGVLVFLPNILLLFLAIAILEDSGYMARAAFLMDRLMQKIGLQGKSFIPLLTGFGCTVPAIMATRTLENERDRLTTMLVAPLMSCGARLPIYVLIIPAFFPPHLHGPMLWSIYLIGIVLAIGSAKLLRSTVLRGETTPLVMELPPYRMPTLQGVTVHMWARGSLYLKRAGGLILAISVILWAMTTFPQKTNYARDYDVEIAQVEESYRQSLASLNDGSDQLAEHGTSGDALLEIRNAHEQQLANLREAQIAENLAHSIAGRIGHGLEPLLRPLGFDWRIGTALIGAFAAKEVFVAQMGIVYSIGEVDEESKALRSKLAANYSPLTAFGLMLFCLVSAPCMATIAITKRESNSWSWALLQLGGLTALAYLLTAAIHQTGTLLRLGV